MSADREAVLGQLLRSLSLSVGEFVLLLAHCNSITVRDEIIAELRARFGTGLYVWNAHPVNEVVNLVEVLSGAPAETQVACVTGLETSPYLNDILAIANNAREELRHRFHFPLVIWVTDEVEAQLRRRAPDLASWAAPPFVFALTASELQATLEQETRDVVERAFLLEGRQGREQEWQWLEQESYRSGLVLSPELEARIALAVGMEMGGEVARESLERCLSLCSAGELAVAACYRLGLWWRQEGKQQRARFLACFDLARNYLQQAWLDESGKRPSVALALAGVLLGLALPEVKKSERWQAVTEFAEQLSMLPALASGLRAEVALVQQEYATAKREAEQALKIDNRPYAGWHRLLLGRSLLGLNQAEAAVASLEQAKEITTAEADPDLHIRILRSLHQAYTAVGNYRQAFAVKCDRQEIEGQYGFRAFIGAGRLRPQRQIGEVGEETTEEIAASGRQADIEALVERVKRSDCRLTVIHGPSGVGKSSLVQAGLVPALRKLIHQSRSVVPLVVEQYEDWYRELVLQLAEPASLLNPPDLGNFEEQPPEPPRLGGRGKRNDRLFNQLRENDRRNLITVLIFDQFEEFFFKNADVPSRRPFYSFLRDCLDVPFIWVMLSLREDYVHYLLECDRLVNLTLINNDILNKNVRYYLGNFDQTRTASVIRELTERSPYRLEPALIGRLTDDLAAELGEVRPIELQVVGAQLLQRDHPITTLAAYTALNHPPKQTLVEDWLNQVVQDCGDKKNRELAQRVLVALTEEPEKRPVKTKTELQREMQPSGAEEDLRLLPEVADLGDLAFVLTVLIGSGLAFEIPATPEAGYQLIHDYLVPPIRRQFGVRLAQQLEEERQQRKLAEANLKKRNRLLLQGSAIAALIFAVLGATALVFALQANEQREKALRQKQEAVKQKGIAEDQANIARNQTKLANDKETEASNEKKEADKQRKLADLKRIEADKERNRAEQAGKAEQAQRKIAEEKAGIAKRAEAKAKELAEKNGLDALNARAVSDSLYWKGLIDADLFSLEEQVALLEKAKNWQDNLSGLRSDSQIELLSTLLRASYIPKEKNRFQGNQDEIWSVAFAPNGKSILTGSGDGTAKLWSLNGQVLQIFKGHKETEIVYSLAFSPDGKNILTGSKDGTAKLWSLNGQVLQTFSGHQGATSVAFSPDGKSILIGSGDGTAKLWSLNGQVLQTFSGHQKAVWSVAFSPDGKSIITGSEDRTAKLWSVSDGQVLKTFSGHQEAVDSVAFAPDGKSILTGSSGGEGVLWSLDGQVLRTLTIREAPEAPNSIAFAPNGKSILTPGEDGVAKLRSLNGQVLQTFSGHKFSFRGRWSDITSVAFSPDGKSFLTGSRDGTAKLWSLDGRKSPTFRRDQERVYSVAFAPDGKSILTQSGNGTTRLWSLDGQLLRTFEGSSDSVAFAPNGKSILIGDFGGTAKLWSFDGRLLQTFHMDRINIYSVAFAPNGKSILIGDQGDVNMWSLDGQLLHTFSGDQGSVYSVAFAPDGQSILTGGGIPKLWNGTAKLWSRNGRLLQTFRHQGAVNNLAFASDGKSILTGSSDGTAKLWSLDGRVLQTFRGHQGHVYSVAFAPDGQSILTHSIDGTAKLWSRNDGRVLQTFSGHQGKITSVAFAPDGKSILIGSEDGTVKLWDLGLGHSLSAMCEHLHNFAAGSSFPSLEEDDRKLRERARRACEGIPPSKAAPGSVATRSLGQLSWFQDIIGAAFQVVFPNSAPSHRHES